MEIQTIVQSTPAPWIALTEPRKEQECWSPWWELVFQDPDQLKFDALVRLWHAERGPTSSSTKIVMCEAYHKIMAMGQDAVPLIMARLEAEGDKPDHWFWALKMITGANPVSLEDRGDHRKMAQSWLDWGRARYAW